MWSAGQYSSTLQGSTVRGVPVRVRPSTMYMQVFSPHSWSRFFCSLYLPSTMLMMREEEMNEGRKVKNKEEKKKERDGERWKGDEV